MIFPVDRSPFFLALSDPSLLICYLLYIFPLIPVSWWTVSLLTMPGFSVPLVLCSHSTIQSATKFQDLCCTFHRWMSKMDRSPVLLIYMVYIFLSFFFFISCWKERMKKSGTCSLEEKKALSQSHSALSDHWNHPAQNHTLLIQMPLIKTSTHLLWKISKEEICFPDAPRCPQMKISFWNPWALV